MSKYLYTNIFISVYLAWSLCYFFRHVWLLRLNGQAFFQLEPIIKVASILRDTQHVVPKLGWTISPFCYLGTRLCLFVSITTSLWELRFYWCHHGYLDRRAFKVINTYSSCQTKGCRNNQKLCQNCWRPTSSSERHCSGGGGAAYS